ncbi:MAG: hypothetical protein QME79_11130 [Bacillota bacterium]|nr:hypothetical protein [Bacillota bacterium]
MDRTERGFALTTALLLVVLLGAGALLVLSLAGSGVRRVRARHDYLAALYAAESGLNEALWRLNPDARDETGVRPELPPSRTYAPDGSVDASFSGTLDSNTGYEVWVDHETDPAHIAVVSLGRRGQARRLLRIQVDRYTLSDRIISYRDDWDQRHHVTLEYLSGDEEHNGPRRVDELPTLQLPAGTWDLSTYSASPISGDWTSPKNYHFTGNIAATGNVVIRNNCTIDGDVVAGGSVSIGNNSRVTGNVVALSGSVTLAQNATVEGSVLAKTGDVSIENNGAAVHGLVYAGGNVSISNNASVLGLVYGAGTVTVHNNGSVQGALIGGSVYAENNATLIYDPSAVTGLDLIVTQTYLTPRDWREGYN